MKPPPACAPATNPDTPPVVAKPGAVGETGRYRPEGETRPRGVDPLVVRSESGEFKRPSPRGIPVPIECHFFGPLREAVGTKTVERAIEPDETVLAVVDDLVADYPDLTDGLLDDDGSIHDAVNVTLNKENINHLNGPETTLEDGDVLRFASAVIGGAR